ncbi:MFS transporter [Thalassotalea insulae]|uniref:MFS transporter n=1 Tax=Thalassotalea insulae TaxID=2056778 RepID=A0ABQ6GW37_9GAMM|nr:organoarsenical effux MFS transporter ArsJ [Thalassotalea insulae]GLX79582.1 MFS transporter [Thalassotalea insulae]
MFSKIQALPKNIQQYLIITGNYWFFTLTDGALRMLVVLYFYQLGYQPLAIAMLFLFYEIFGVITNLVGGWLGARIGLNKTMNIGLALQVGALLMLALPQEMLTMYWVMLAQALSGIAKDLNKMSAKSSVKSLVKNDSQQNDSPLFKWVAILTGSKNALKGAGFFLGGALLALVGFQYALLSMALILLVITIASICLLEQDLGKAKAKPKFSEVFSKSAALNYLSAARLCLFAARDVWFVVALPLFLITKFAWSHQFVGGFMAIWVIAYGAVQAKAPRLLAWLGDQKISGQLLSVWVFALALLTFVIAVAIYGNFSVYYMVIIGLLVFGAVFAINSSLHSYLVVAMAKEDGVSMDVGFYYMANAMGRLLGTVLSGYIYQAYGLATCLMISSLLALMSGYFIRRI